MDDLAEASANDASARRTLAREGASDVRPAAPGCHPRAARWSWSRRTVYPLLTTRLTFVPLGSDLPAAGLCEITRPFLTWLELAFLTLPTAQ